MLDYQRFKPTMLQPLRTGARQCVAKKDPHTIGYDPDGERTDVVDDSGLTHDAMTSSGGWSARPVGGADHRVWV
jgi:hypothetical protein